MYGIQNYKRLKPIQIEFLRFVMNQSILDIRYRTMISTMIELGVYSPNKRMPEEYRPIFKTVQDFLNYLRKEWIDVYKQSKL